MTLDINSLDLRLLDSSFSFQERRKQKGQPTSFRKVLLFNVHTDPPCSRHSKYSKVEGMDNPQHLLDDRRLAALAPGGVPALQAWLLSGLFPRIREFMNAKVVGMFVLLRYRLRWNGSLRDRELSSCPGRA